jgi:hypothetical protein
MNGPVTPVDAATKREVVQLVFVSYHIAQELLKLEDRLDTTLTAAIVNGLLSRLRGAWTNFPPYFGALTELQPVGVARKNEKGGPVKMRRDIDTTLAVLSAATESFLDVYMPEARIGFQREEME